MILKLILTKVTMKTLMMTRLYEIRLMIIIMISVVQIVMMMMMMAPLMSMLIVLMMTLCFICFVIVIASNILKHQFMYDVDFSTCVPSYK